MPPPGGWCWHPRWIAGESARARDGPWPGPWSAVQARLVAGTDALGTAARPAGTQPACAIEALVDLLGRHVLHWDDDGNPSSEAFCIVLQRPVQAQRASCRERRIRTSWGHPCRHPATRDWRHWTGGALWLRLVRWGSGPHAGVVLGRQGDVAEVGQRLAQLPAGGDAELGEHLSQVPLDRARAEE